jgi:hypothetical protein
MAKLFSLQYFLVLARPGYEEDLNDPGVLIISITPLHPSKLYFQLFDLVA